MSRSVGNHTHKSLLLLTNWGSVFLESWSSLSWRMISLLVFKVHFNIPPSPIYRTTFHHSPRSHRSSFRCRSLSATTYQMQASQCATRVKDSISSVSIMALYCEYRSIFCSRRASRSNRVNFNRCMCEGPASCNENRWQPLEGSVPFLSPSVRGW